MIELAQTQTGRAKGLQRPWVRVADLSKVPCLRQIGYADPGQGADHGELTVPAVMQSKSEHYILLTAPVTKVVAPPAKGNNILPSLL